MAKCGNKCPYYWHDSECEYCGARGDEVIDLKNYSYETCPYYEPYYKEELERRKAQKERRSGNKNSTGKISCLGCLGEIIGWIIAIALFIFIIKFFFSLL